LELLLIGGNQYLTGSIPSLAAMSSLQRFQIEGCALTGTLPDFSGLTAINTIILSSNKLGGTLPNAFPALSQLSGLFLDDNQFHGSFPDMTALRSLKYADVGSNQLSGTLPLSVGALRLISTFNIDNNKLTGPILDAHFANWTQPHYVYFKNNSFRGSLPSAVGKLSSAIALSFSYNNIGGTLPDLSALTKLHQFSVVNCGLEGPLPRLPPAFTSIYLANNKLTGAIPVELMHSPTLVDVTIYNNKFTSFGADSFDSDTIVSVLIADNSIKGPFPQLRLPALEYLGADSNLFSG
jgi:hypothetical protein